MLIIKKPKFFFLAFLILGGVAMNFEKTCEDLSQEFIYNPINFVTEFDLQARLQRLLREGLSIREAAVKNPQLKGTTNGYKKAYWKNVQKKLREQGKIDRVHTEVRLVNESGKEPDVKGRIDAVVFNESINGRIRWDNGSKRFPVGDVASAFELKFVKNRPKFPTKEKIKNLKGKSNEKVRKDLDLTPNKIEDDLKELGKLSEREIEEVYLLIFSNKNYLYLHQGEVTPEEKQHKYNSLYEELGKSAREKIKEISNDNVNVLYTHPLMEKRGKWIA